MHYSPTIYISHHHSDVEKAKEIAASLLQIGYICEESINYLETILPGSHISEDIFDKIKMADLIIVLPSSTYVAKCKQEISWIKSSQSYKNQKVLPIPFPNSLWKDVFPDIMPLPRKSWFENIPFDGEWLFEVVIGVKSVINNNTVDISNRYMPLMVARADSNSIEYSQESLPDGYGITLEHDEILVPIQGDSMSPCFEEGDFAICKPIDLKNISTEKSGKRRIYVIRTKSQGNLLKYIDEINSYNITLASENTSHDNFVLDGAEIDSIYLVVRSIKVRAEF